jgi:uncharacterized protein YjeT (DUF2065 family)
MPLIEGGLAFSNPSNMYNRLMDWYLDSISDQTHRLFGIIPIILGTAVFFLYFERLNTLNAERGHSIPASEFA